MPRSLRFYSGVLGLQVMQRYGEGAVFLSAGGYHHHIALNTWESLGGSPPPAGTTGLYHTAILYPTRAALATALRRLLAAKIPLQGAADHGVSESLYLNDPDENGVELYCDKPRRNSGRATLQGNWKMYTRRLDLHALLSEAPEGSELQTWPPRFVGRAFLALSTSVGQADDKKRYRLSGVEFKGPQRPKRCALAYVEYCMARSIRPDVIYRFLPSSPSVDLSNAARPAPCQGESRHACLTVS